MDYRCGDKFLSQELIKSAYVPAAALCADPSLQNGNEPTIVPLLDMSAKARLARHRAPRLANQLQVCCGNTEEHDLLYSTIHQYDLIVHTPDFIDQPDTTQYFGSKGTIRLANPDVVQFVYMSPFDIPRYIVSLPPAGDRYYFKFSRDWVFSLKDSWLLKGIAGEPVKIYFDPGSETYTEAMNQATGANFYIPQFLYDRMLKYDIVDGVFWDWVGTSISWLNDQSFNEGNEIDMNRDGIADNRTLVDTTWSAGLLKLYQNMAGMLSPGMLQMGNFGFGSFLPEYMEYLNGGMMEQFLVGPTNTPDYYTWDQQMRNYSYSCRYGVQPTTSFLQYIDDTTDDDPDIAVYPKMRFALGSALMFDGYFSYTATSFGSYVYNRWVDEFAVDIRSGKATTNLSHKGWLGEALGEAYAVEDSSIDFYTTLWAGLTDIKQGLTAGDAPGGSFAQKDASNYVWRRDYENGIVIINPKDDSETVDLGGSFRKIRGKKDRVFNDGSLITEIELGHWEGVILLR